MENYIEDFDNSKLVVYTVIMGGYDTLKEPEYIDDNCDYVCFTDNKELKSGIWQIRLVGDYELDSTRKQREYKILTHKFLPEYKYSVYVDGNIRILGSLRDYVRKQWKGASLLALVHPERDNVYDEAEACIKFNKDNPDIIRKQVDRYRNEGYKANNRLILTGLLFRKHNDSNLISVMETWWNEVKNNSRRDQISFGYSCWKSNFIYDVSELRWYRSNYWQNPGIHTVNIRDFEDELIDHIQLEDYLQYLINEKDKCIAEKEQEIISKNQELEAAKNNLSIKDRENEDLKTQLDDINNSFSWKCTAIFRKIQMLLKK